MGAPVNHRRMKPRLAKQPAHIERVKAMGCLVCGQSPVDAHHVRTGLKPRDDRRIVPLCREHHTTGPLAFHRLGSSRTFYQEHGVDLPAEAERLEQESRAAGIMR